ncbi:hypothetical protein [Streptomyces sp. 4F14]|uniref:hypothetical protein n=1 Tax=Streptomyces sp. 4F14 TaxID=3394380 RepID=UPI003A8B1ABD
MSWDVYILRFPSELTGTDELPEGWEPPSLGTGREVRAVLARTLPGIVLGEDGWGDFDGPGVSLNLSVSGAGDEPVTSVALHFYGGGPASAPTALAVAEALTARALDLGSGDFLTPDTARSALDAWRGYRDHVLGRP